MEIKNCAPDRRISAGQQPAGKPAGIADDRADGWRGRLADSGDRMPHGTRVAGRFSPRGGLRRDRRGTGRPIAFQPKFPRRPLLPPYGYSIAGNRRSQYPGLRDRSRRLEHRRPHRAHRDVVAGQQIHPVSGQRRPGGLRRALCGRMLDGFPDDLRDGTIHRRAPATAWRPRRRAGPDRCRFPDGKAPAGVGTRSRGKRGKPDQSGKLRLRIGTRCRGGTGCRKRVGQRDRFGTAAGSPAMGAGHRFICGGRSVHDAFGKPGRRSVRIRPGRPGRRAGSAMVAAAGPLSDSTRLPERCCTAGLAGRDLQSGSFCRSLRSSWPDCLGRRFRDRHGLFPSSTAHGCASA